MGTSTFSGPVVSQGGFQTANAAGTATAGIISGAGVPSLAAPQGTLYLNTTGASTTTRLYINTNGTTGWTAFTSIA